ncbi:MAG: hypothetical protein ACFFAY_06495, partial [Promethearchaeota archaeon]
MSNFFSPILFFPFTAIDVSSNSEMLPNAIPGHSNTDQYTVNCLGTCSIARSGNGMSPCLTK